LKKQLLTLVFIFSWSIAFSQIEDAWVYFKDKPGEAAYYATPLNMLSQRALDRRIRYNIALDFKDIPIEPTYISAVSNATGITVLAKSKWLNALHIQGTKLNIDALLNLELSNFLIVDSIEYANRTLNGSKPNFNSKRNTKVKNKQLEIATNFTYGNAENQLLMLGGEILHQNNFTGAGMQIAVMDAGFPNVNTLLAFKRIKDNGQILGGYDFVNRVPTYNTGSVHGTMVLSTMAGFLKVGENGATANFVGTAPDADYYLFITENSDVEVRLEESLWVEAAEKADSLGVDVINTSLGYSVFFDNPDHNYNYADMDGQTTFISRGAEVAFSRGMILVTSAGNEGTNSSWPYINAPADAPSVLTVGAVNSAGIIASFSSFGPTSDNRIKPDVCAQGQLTALINSSGSVTTGNGTSFSSPVLAGVVACLWQAFPNKTNAEITQLIKESAHLFTSPNNQEGYGIPNFSTIFDALDIENYDNTNFGVFLYPNPVINEVYFNFTDKSSEINISIYDIKGTVFYKGIVTKNKPFVDISFLSTGIYLIQVNDDIHIKNFKIVKN
jgi:subtilisin family serine protease